MIDKISIRTDVKPDWILDVLFTDGKSFSVHSREPDPLGLIKRRFNECHRGDSK